MFEPQELEPCQQRRTTDIPFLRYEERPFEIGLCAREFLFRNGLVSNLPGLFQYAIPSFLDLVRFRADVERIQARTRTGRVRGADLIRQSSPVSQLDEQPRTHRAPHYAVQDLHRRILRVHDLRRRIPDADPSGLALPLPIRFGGSGSLRQPPLGGRDRGPSRKRSEGPFEPPKQEVRVELTDRGHGHAARHVVFSEKRSHLLALKAPHGLRIAEQWLMVGMCTVVLLREKLQRPRQKPVLTGLYLLERQILLPGHLLRGECRMQHDVEQNLQTGLERVRRRYQKDRTEVPPCGAAQPRADGLELLHDPSGGTAPGTLEQQILRQFREPGLLVRLECASRPNQDRGSDDPVRVGGCRQDGQSVVEKGLAHKVSVLDVMKSAIFNSHCLGLR